MYVSTLGKCKKKFKHTSGFVLETSRMYVFYEIRRRRGLSEKRMQRRKTDERQHAKEGIYRTAMRICRMWGVAETLDSGIPPYETPIATQSAENEKLVLQWAEEYVQLRENGEELWRFFEKKIKNLRKPEQN